MPETRRWLVLAVFVALSACVSAGRFPEAVGAWRGGNEARELAQAEYERFRDGNGLSEATVVGDLEAVRAVYRETPIVLEGDELVPEPAQHEAEGLLKGGMAGALSKDLGSTGVFRVLRAIRAVERLGVARHAPELLAIVWRRDAFVVDHASLPETSTARRSLLVKRAAIDALEALRQAR
ncbi:MAG TPA: hypothetical protein PK095_15855 [Myxococcota bacterium]|nr:hypothetical protein [Myxococcota bacterium]